MILKGSNNFTLLILIFFLFLPLKGEEKIDIWNNKKKDEVTKPIERDKSKNNNLIGTKKILERNKENIIKIEDGEIDVSQEKKVFGIYDPAKYNFDLNMWSSTNAEDVLSSLKRLDKIKLSKTSNDILEKILLSFSYPPIGMDEEQFSNLKINWLIKNNRSKLIEEFLVQNKEFKGKRKAVQFLVDESIAQANINEGCEKIKFIDSTIKDSYLEKFKIYCYVFSNDNSQAQLLLDILREQKKSDKFFDDKINYLLGISEKTSNKINEKTLLNFYLSSVTIPDFKYDPNDKTKKEIWKYLNAANLIKIEDVTNKKKIRDLELAANTGQLDENLIFNIYKQIPFNLNTLINANNIYKSLESTDARALIYQKFLLSESPEKKLEYLFLLEDLFKKDKFQRIYSTFLSNKLREIDTENIPQRYLEIVNNRIIKNKEEDLGKIKYNDKIIHQSRIVKYYTEEEDNKKIQKDIDKIFKKIGKNRKYFYSAKDLALADSLVKDGFSLPPNFKFQELSQKYEVPKNLIELIENRQSAFLALKIVEIIGEDEPKELDPETIFFITNLLNETNLVNLRNKILISALPQRI